MAEYRKSEAREWAKANMRGVANVIIPTFTQDLRKLNERAIRHDVRKEIEYGFWGTLLVSETATTIAEYTQFAEWAADEPRGNCALFIMPVSIHSKTISRLCKPPSVPVRNLS